MSKLNVDQKTIILLLSDKKSDFLIPDYQRPYAWKETQCQTLWDDLVSFAFPDNNSDKFDINDEYFLGSIVTFENEDKKKEVIDGQQRLTTLMLLLRAFYDKFGNMQDENSLKIKNRISQCLWKTNEFGDADLDVLKITSEVAMDDDKNEFLNILKTGKIEKNYKSNYAKNYCFFQEKINIFLNEYPSYFVYLPARILNNCIFLPIEAESQDTALRIFSTLNDRGLPLSDADIFKAQLYKFYNSKNEREEFIESWKELETICSKIFSSQNTPMDELFTRYMYFMRANQGIKSSTTEALRKFYEKDKYSLLKNENTLLNLRVLADFWNDVYNQREDKFSKKVLKKLFILNYAPNSMWHYFLSVYFLKNRDENNLLEEEKLDEFLTRIIAFIWSYAFVKPGVNALRTPVYAEMVNIVEGKEISFSEFKIEKETLKSIMNHFEFNNGRPITKSILTWWIFSFEDQEIPSLTTNFEIEHIFAKKRQENDKTLTNIKNLESLGNKSLLESRINIRASDYKFDDKIKYYRGFVNDKGINKEGTMIAELKEIKNKYSTFSENNIEFRNQEIINKFISFVEENNILK